MMACHRTRRGIAWLLIAYQAALTGCTRHGASALGLGDDIGTLAVGKAADLAAWNIDEPPELAYWLGAAPLAQRWLAGQPIT